MSVGAYTAGAPKTLGTWTVMGKEVLTGFGRIVISEIEAPILLANLVRESVERQYKATLRPNPRC
jgi:hypothetical protein